MAGIFDIELHDGLPEGSEDEDDAIDIAEVNRLRKSCL